MAGCAEIRPELGVYLLGAIAPPDRARVVGHLVSCPRCREELAGMAALPALLRRQPPGTAERLAQDGAPVMASDLGGAPAALAGRIARRRRRYRWLTAAAVAVLAGAAGAGWASRLTSAAPGHASASTVLETVRLNGATVLTDTEGFTVYWFARDTATASLCTGSCAWHWPPVAGPAVAEPGLPGRLGTIVRPDGTLQATWDGHPLYTATLDTAPGEANGNDLTSAGGIWREIVISGQAPASPPPSPSRYDGY
jgi:predicted lipoprotein with Yx(FWY)xxD motif